MKRDEGICVAYARDGLREGAGAVEERGHGWCGLGRNQAYCTEHSVDSVSSVVNNRDNAGDICSFFTVCSAQ